MQLFKSTLFAALAFVAFAAAAPSTLGGGGLLLARRTLLRLPQGQLRRRVQWSILWCQDL
ncbi:hypothetical protein FIBSPDRAFT_876827, partial [Athelia psychrophila]